MAAFSDAAELSWAALTGAPSFRRVALAGAQVLRNYQFRDVFSQALTLESAASARLAERLKELTSTNSSYRYDPLRHNCSSELRDLLRGALGERLSSDSLARNGPTFRDLAEEGLRGRVLPLLLLELTGGPMLDRRTTEWERMAFPIGLHDSVAARLAVPSEQLFRRFDAAPPGSPHAGRIVLGFVVAALTFAAARGGPGRQGSKRLGPRLVPLTLTGLALLPWLASLSALEAPQHNWTRWVLLPFDLLLLGLPGRAAQLYLRVRLLGLGALLVGVASGLVPRSVTYLALMVALLLVALWRGQASPAPAPGPQAAAAR